jgi:hypothetical protein
METEGSLQYSQVHVTLPYPQSDPYSPRPHPTSWRLILILFSHPRLVFQMVSLLKVSPPKPYITSPLPIRATCLAHLILIDLIIMLLIM